MHHIKKLDGLTIAKIAAGEVIDRPVSVVKELVENSIDSGAQQIHVTIQRGGLDLIQVVDDGRGIVSNELSLAVEDHATSKIQSVDDLFLARSMGFRGEALASIRHVARLRIVSRTEDNPLGAQVDAYGLEIGDIIPVVHSKGTSVTVCDLFRNIPVRQKFLKSPATEFSYIHDLLVGLSLHYPLIEFVLCHDQKEVLNTRGILSLDDRLAVLWGKELRGKLLPVKFELSDYSVTGVISSPAVNYSNRNRQVVTVNGRLIKSAVLQRALSQAAADAIPNGRFLACVVNIGVPNGHVDINIHPQKLDVRFANSGFVFDVVMKAIRLALSGIRSEERLAAAPPSSATWLKQPLDNMASHTNVLFQAIEWGGQSDLLPTRSSRDISYIQMFDTYLIVNAGDALVVLDQHAVHERILYEKIKDISAESTYRQPLLAAEVIGLSPDQYARFGEVESVFQKMGFEVDDFGPNQIVVRQVPVSLAGPSPERLILSILDSFFDNPDMSWDLVLQDKDRLQRMACRAAIKAGKRMAFEEVTAMILDLIDTPGNYTCPHGRPLFITWTKSDFEKMFLRT